MIVKAILFIQQALNQNFKNRYGIQDDVVIMNNVINPEGNVPIENTNKMVISLLNLEQENNKQFYGRNHVVENGNIANINPTERYNLDILFSSNFSDYAETLKFLNATVTFFQANNTITNETYSDLPKGINRLDFDLEQISYHQMHSLWSAMGAKYQPSVIYKIRLIEIQSNEILEITPSIDSLENNLGEK